MFFLSGCSIIEGPQGIFVGKLVIKCKSGNPTSEITLVTDDKCHHEVVHSHNMGQFLRFNSHAHFLGATTRLESQAVRNIMGAARLKLGQSLSEVSFFYYYELIFFRKLFLFKLLADNLNKIDTWPPKTEVRRLFSKFFTANILFWEYLGVICFRPKNQSFLQERGPATLSHV